MFTKEERVERQKAATSRWRKANPEKYKAGKKVSHTKWRKANREHYAEKCRKWRKANPDKHRESVTKCQKANPKKYREIAKTWQRANPEKMKEYMARWRDANPEKAMECRREAAKRGNYKRRVHLNVSGTSHTAKEWKAKLIEYNHSCAYCGTSGIKITRDHYMPLSKGGNNSIENIRPACQPCNSRKKDQWPWN